MYCSLLDASKAFDIIHYDELFFVLSTKMPVTIFRLIIDSNVRQSVRISWNVVYTNYFQLLSGVKQGGVLSAKLFTLYIDDKVIDFTYNYIILLWVCYLMPMTIFYHALALVG